MESIGAAISHAPDKHARADVKWTALFLSDESFSCLERAYRAPGVKRLGDNAEVDVGIVTGRNNFFVIDNKRAEELELNGYSLPSVGRTSSLRSIIFTKDDFIAHSAKHPSILVNLNGVEEADLSRRLRDYIARAEEEGVNRGYKCRVRRRWFDVPSIYVPDAFLFRQIHAAPLLVANEAGATSTDTIHRVRFKKRISGRRFAAAFCNSLTFAWAEVCGRSYGGGVLELEPGEAEELPIPLAAAMLLDQRTVDRLLRSSGIEAALDYTDPILLGQGLGLGTSQMASLRDSWRLLRDRRKNRRHVARGQLTNYFRNLGGAIDAYRLG